MATTTISYSSPTTITCSVASTATSSTWVAGRESTEVDNTTNKYDDALVQGKITVGTTPTASTLILVYVWGSDTSAGTTAIDVIDGTDSAETITSAGVRDGFMRLGAQINVDATTSDRAYPFGPFSVADLFGQMPKYWGLFVTHNTGVNLNSTGGNHAFTYTGIKFDTA
jgi:hypothetical protein